MALLKLKQSKKIKLTSDVLEFLANKITNNVREMEGALNRLAVHASLQESEITVDLVKDVLKDLLRTNSRKITIDEIQKKVVSITTSNYQTCTLRADLDLLLDHVK